jgi:hypothetical protein
MRKSLSDSRVEKRFVLFVRHFCLPVIERTFSDGGFNRAAELQMPLVNPTDIEIHFNFAGIG